MFSVPHIVVIFIVVLVLFGPHKLPELARGLGKMMAEFRKASTDFRLAFEEEMRNIERQAREAEIKKVQDAAAANAVEQTATLATPPEDRILPPAEPVEPTVSPVSEAVAREINASGEAPVTEGTPPATTGADESLSNRGTDSSPAHDRQPA